VPSNGLSLSYGISISNLPLKVLDGLCSMCSTGGRVLTGVCVCVLYCCGGGAVAVLAYGGGCVAVSTGGLVYAVI
jgi:hypothetical protein